MPLEAFSPDKRAKDGRQSSCRACGRAAHAANADRNNARSRERRAAAGDAWREHNRACYAANRDREVARVAGSYRRNSTARKDYAKSYAQANRDKRVQYEAKRRAITAGCKADIINPREVFEAAGWRCYICGVGCIPGAASKTRFAPEMDHIVSLARGGQHIRSNVACACYPCNLLKGANRTAEQVREMFA